ncbi:MAG: 23S rRNA (adenine(2503)-C(2))-methyltransferase RlmN [Candidatus Dojkabacteria bacterium]
MITEFVKNNKLPAFREQQFNEAYFKQGINSVDELTTWPKELRQRLRHAFKFTTLGVETEFSSKNSNTIKTLFKRKDGQRIETVLMRYKDGRNTVCVSCMVGCPVNCSFCATGKMGFGGNLSAREIVDQVMHFERRLMKEGAHVTNVVFMGMGEPMLNILAVQEALHVMTDTDRLGLGKRRITISTSGYIPQLRQLIKDGFCGRLAISLHAPNQKLREKLMPVAKLFPLGQLLRTLDDFTELTNKRVSYEYVIIQGVNDKDEHARELGKLFKRRLAHINLIPYNPIREAPFKRSSKRQISVFKTILEDYGIPVSIRSIMGDDVNAACGQLADRANKAHESKRID